MLPDEAAYAYAAAEVGHSFASEGLPTLGVGEGWQECEETQSKSRRWQLDESVTFCSLCANDFGMMLRRHHCRTCGARCPLPPPSLRAHRPSPQPSSAWLRRRCILRRLHGADEAVGQKLAHVQGVPRRGLCQLSHPRGAEPRDSVQIFIKMAIIQTHVSLPPAHRTGFPSGGEPPSGPPRQCACVKIPIYDCRGPSRTRNVRGEPLLDRRRHAKLTAVKNSTPKTGSCFGRSVARGRLAEGRVTPYPLASLSRSHRIDFG